MERIVLETRHKITYIQPYTCLNELQHNLEDSFLLGFHLLRY